MILRILALFVGGSFLCYGVSCMVSRHMKEEFRRFGLARWRVLTGVLQVVGAIGVLLGLMVPELGCIASGGLALQMLLGVGVRIKIGDSALQAFPAFFYLVVSAALAVAFLQG